MIDDVRIYLFLFMVAVRVSVCCVWNEYHILLNEMCSHFYFHFRFNNVVI